jgi:hypothetical protein
MALTVAQAEQVARVIWKRAPGISGSGETGETVPCFFSGNIESRDCLVRYRRNGARAASGQVTAAPPSSVMNSRRFR